MSAPLQNIAIVRASGQVGSFITKALISQGKHTVTAITRGHKPTPTPRNSSAQMPAGLHAIKEVDYDSHPSLVTAMQGQDLLIITMNVLAPRDSQTKLIDAAIEAGIKWIMPNQYGGYYADDDSGPGKDDMLRDITVATRRYIEAKGASWIGVACGFWYEFSLSGGEIRYGFDFEKKSLTLFDEGTVKHTCSTWPLVGRAVAKLLALPVSGGSPCLEEWRNRQVVFSSFAVSQRDMLASVLRVTGDEEGEWRITREGSRERFERGQEMFKGGEIAGFGMLLYARVFFPDGDGDLTGLRENGRLGLLGEEEDLDEATRVAVGYVESGKAKEWSF
ncbi:hypothetical protein B0A55_01209 [Friedmanniomyces simplex]|uniref:NmrA-like domain-containing protein n=1 Tax=Friedmanniomyces simplex TaxID=329884 RepID=A0A4U0XXN6_9PEZI|nr:hypothetical protein B0A55_01209 [Friedmanniomyces simplex]